MKTTDYCSAWPDKWISYDYSACCKRHDEDYADPKVGRLEADNRLFKCVKAHSNLLMATTMWIGVRCCGWMFKTWAPPTS